jgi:hypothetical protein
MKHFFVPLFSVRVFACYSCARAQNKVRISIATGGTGGLIVTMSTPTLSAMPGRQMRG